ncbi:hypothetical protein ACFE04_026610 [Oxalis oulophora]
MSHLESIVSNSASIDDVEHHLTNSKSGSYSDTFSSSADDDDSAPFSGQTFPTLESLIAFYQEHAKLNGFSIVKQSYRRNMSGGEHRQLGCSRLLLNGIKEVGPSQYGTCQTSTVRDLETDGMNISDQGAPVLDPHKIKRKKGRGKGNSKQTTTFRSDRAPNRSWKKKKVVNELLNTDSNVPHSQGTFI